MAAGDLGTVNVESAAEHPDNQFYVVGTLTYGTYGTGGQALAGKITGGGATLGRISYLQASGGGYVSDFDVTNQKLKLRYQTDPAAVGGADVALKEVANSADLSAVTVPFLAIGQ